MSLLQLLTQSLEGDDSATPASHNATEIATDKPADEKTTNEDANATALAQFTQALAAALGASAAPPPPQGVAANAAPAASDEATAGVTDATQSSNGSSARDPIYLLASQVSADATGKSDAVAVAPQFAAAATKETPADASAANTAAAGPNSLAQLGVASHFATQHLQNGAHMGELKSPPGSAAWNDELGGQLTWMTQKGLESGSLRISPEHLGPVEVQISVQNGDASVWFGANHPDTHAALEQALPRLREMFASQGMTLTDSGVSRESPRNQVRAPRLQSVAGVAAVASTDLSTSSAVRLSLGLVDTYA